MGGETISMDNLIFFVLSFLGNFLFATILLTKFLISKDIITLILTAIGLRIAWIGLETWKKQIKGTREWETAYNLNLSIIKLREAIKYVRKPGTPPSEKQQAIQYGKNKHPEKHEEDIEKNVDLYTYEIRWQKISEATVEMESHLLAAEFFWGSDILNKLKPLNKKITELNIGLLQYFQPQFRVKNFEELYEIVYNMSTEETEDKFSKEVSQAVEDVKSYIKSKIPHLEM